MDFKSGAETHAWLQGPIAHAVSRKTRLLHLLSRMVCSDSESAPAGGRPTQQDSGESSAVADSESLLSCLPEEWRAFSIEFDFTYTEIVCLMSTAPDQTRDDTVLNELISKLEVSLDISDWMQAQHFLCVLVRSDPLHAVDAMCSSRLSSVAVRAARLPESGHRAAFTRRLGRALFSQLVAFVDQVSAGAALECGGDGGGEGVQMDCDGVDGGGGGAL